MAYSAIDVGAGAADYTYGTRTSTILDLTNPVNATGVLTSFELWFTDWDTGGNGTDVVVGTFYGTSPSWTSRDSEALGTVTCYSKQTFTGKNCDATIGDIIGEYNSGGNIGWEASGGSGTPYISGNQFGTGAKTYDVSLTTRRIALYATGVTVPDAPTSVSATDNLTDKVTITWTAGTGETDGHKVYRDGSVLNGDTAIVHGTNTFDDTTAVIGTTYAYTVKAINAAGLSAASSADNGTRTAATSFIPRIMQHNFIPPFIGGS